MNLVTENAQKPLQADSSQTSKIGPPGIPEFPFKIENFSVKQKIPVVGGF